MRRDSVKAPGFRHLRPMLLGARSVAASGLPCLRGVCEPMQQRAIRCGTSRPGAATPGSPAYLLLARKRGVLKRTMLR
jgi:hypothetical protein